MRLALFRQAMLPIEKPPEMVHFKKLVGLAVGADDAGPSAEEKRGGNADRKGGKGGKGKGREREEPASAAKGGRYVQDMGKTELMKGSQKGQWWRNCDSRIDVIVREFFALSSPEVSKVPPGHYIQQSGPCEVFVSGRAEGLQRMPVFPKGFVTVDATAVGGPKYLEPVLAPRWKVVFSSGSAKADIIVRADSSLDSPEVAVLMHGSVVDQSGPHIVLADGIVRMPISFSGHIGQEPSDPSRSPRQRQGWVTCDATSQGGPKFFEPCPDEEQPQGQGPGAWDKNRMWKVVNLVESGRQLALTSKAEPCVPGSGKVPPEDMSLGWLTDGDLVEQVGHSKKVRGNMVMPVRVVGGSCQGASGWVTRRLVDKARDTPEDAWFVELRNGEAHAGDRDRRKPRGRRHED